MSRLAKLEARVRELDENLRQRARANTTARAQRVAYELPGDLGVVRVTAGLELSAVEIDIAKLHFTSAAVLGKQLLDGIRAAEQEVREMTAEIVAASTQRPQQRHQVLTAHRRR